MEWIFADALAPERVRGVVKGLGLTKDADYLTELLGRLEGDRAKAVAARLKELAGAK